MPGKRAGLGLVKPARVSASALPRRCWTHRGGNLLIARDAGGWASAAMVDEIYGHVDVHDPEFDAALRTVWGEEPVSGRNARAGCRSCIRIDRTGWGGTGWRSSPR